MTRSIDNPLERLVGYQLRRVSAAAMGTLVRDLAAHGVSPIEGSILLLTGANPGITQSGIGRVLSIKRANMTPLAAGLVGRGLIERAPVDGRSQSLTLSDLGRDLAAAIGRTMRNHDAALLQCLSDDMQRLLVEALQCMQQEQASTNDSAGKSMIGSPANAT